jgi:hypothetical protein
MRALLVSFLLLTCFGAVKTESSADTGAETDITFETQNVGVLTIAITGDSVTFLRSDGGEPGVSTLGGEAVRATVSIRIIDTRADGVRSGYTIALSASPFRALSSSTPISSENLSIASIGTGDGIQLDLAGLGQTLDAPVTLVIVEDEAPAVDITLIVEVEMILPPGTMAGAYEGQLTLDLLPNNDQ